MKKFILYIIVCITWYTQARAQSSIRGTVLSSATHQPLAGASIAVKNTLAGTNTDEQGQFRIDGVPPRAVLQISHIGYKTLELSLNAFDQMGHVALLDQKEQELKEVTVSTGYQTLPQERATGSFVQVSNSLLNRSVSTDILSRLAGVTSGLIFNNVGGSAISIRGQSTIMGNANPLIVIDNFPYDGDILNINPNDVESVTVLKDAAAASIWGSRAGNGVIVITTKKGRYNQSTQVSFNVNVMLGGRPNLFYLPQMSSTDYIAVEKMLFSQGYYDAFQQDPSHQPLTPVVQLLYAQQAGALTPGQVNAQIAAYEKQDVRNDISKYLFRPSANQQYNLSLSGGSTGNRYLVSAGYDHNLDNAAGNGYDRVTLNASNETRLLKDKLEIGTQFYFTGSKTPQNALPVSSLNLGGFNSQPLYPYASIAGPDGKHLAIVHDFSTDFVDAAPGYGLLDWHYRPLDELRLNNNQNTQTDFRLNTSLKYHLLPWLSASVLYQYGRTVAELRNNYSPDSYYARNLINEFTQFNEDGTLGYAVPRGGILDVSSTTTIYQDARAQLDIHKTFGSDHELTAIGGAEIRDNHSSGYATRFYGYDNAHASNKPVDYTGTYTYSFDPDYTGNMVPNYDAFTELTDRFLSYYSNIGYSYRHRYLLSASARLDQSNLFGVHTNQKGVPLYSLGAGWTLTEEPFWHSQALTYLKLRITYGYNGNIDKSLSAYTTALYFDASASPIGQNIARIVNPPNPELRWERDRIINFGADFGTKNNRISGTIEYFRKSGIDLIGNSPYPPQTGISLFTGNNADTKGQGVDLTLNTRNLTGKLGWQTNFLFSYVKDEVSKYLATSTNAVSDYLTGGYPIPTAGKPLYGIYSFRWAGLDPESGAPRGYLNGAVSEDYAGIRAATTAGNLVYNGPGRPVTFGALRNTFTYGPFSLSANISYRLGYYVRRQSVNYASVLTGAGGYGDFALRWQKPGDQAHTQVPSMPSIIDPDRENFYTYASVLVERGDNIRLQDLQFSFTTDRQHVRRLPFSKLQLYVYANNLALLWKAAKNQLDPDYLTQYTLPPVRTIAVGLKGTFN